MHRANPGHLAGIKRFGQGFALARRFKGLWLDPRHACSITATAVALLERLP
jgi:hypothetical protein